jgi:hypothetical protein
MPALGRERMDHLVSYDARERARELGHLPGGIPDIAMTERPAHPGIEDEDAVLLAPLAEGHRHRVPGKAEAPLLTGENDGIDAGLGDGLKVLVLRRGVKVDGQAVLAEQSFHFVAEEFESRRGKEPRRVVPHQGKRWSRLGGSGNEG